MSGREEMREQIAQAFGPEVMSWIEADADGYGAACREADAREAAFIAARREQADEIATMINAGVIRIPGVPELPEGMCFDWTS